MKKKLTATLKILAVAYLLLCIILFVFQDKLIFLPEKLGKDFKFSFDQKFEEINIPAKDTKFLSSAVGAQTEATYTDTYEHYGAHSNPDGFSLLHTNNHELILIPGLKFQMNNPGRVIRTGKGVNYQIDYTYTYDNKQRPILKTGDLKFNSGPKNGQHFETKSTFSYYD